MTILVELQLMTRPTPPPKWRCVDSAKVTPPPPRLRLPFPTRRSRFRRSCPTTFNNRDHLLPGKKIVPTTQHSGRAPLRGSDSAPPQLQLSQHQRNNFMKTGRCQRHLAAMSSKARLPRANTLHLFRGGKAGAEKHKKSARGGERAFSPNITTFLAFDSSPS